jgi:hypothetical protein
MAPAVIRPSDLWRTPRSRLFTGNEGTALLDLLDDRTLAPAVPNGYRHARRSHPNRFLVVYRAARRRDPGGTAQHVLNHQMAPGAGGVIGNGSGPIAQRAPNQPLRMSMDAATVGQMVTMATYFQPQLG